MKTSENIYLLSVCDLCISGRLCALIPARLIMSLSVYNGYHVGFVAVCVMPRVRSWGHIVAPSLCWLMSCEQMQQATWLTTDPSNLRQQTRARTHSATEDSDSLVFLSVFSFDRLSHCTFLRSELHPSPLCSLPAAAHRSSVPPEVSPWIARPRSCFSTSWSS